MPGAWNGCSGCIDAWQHQPVVSYNYQPTSEMVPQLPSLLARHSKTKRPSVLARNRPIFIILYYYTTSTRVLREIPGILPIWPKIWLILGPKPNQPQTRLRAQNLTISTQLSRENREEKRGCCREKRKGKQTGCERKSLFSPTSRTAAYLLLT